MAAPVYVVDGRRTPFLKARGGPGPFSAADLAVAAGAALLDALPIAPDQLDEVILGCVLAGPEEVNIGRVAALRLGCGHRVPAWTVMRNCGSGLQAIDSGVRAIAAGQADLVLAGGVEAMSRAPLHLSDALTGWLAAWGQAKTLAARAALLARLRPAWFKPVVVLLKGLTDPVVGLSMGQTAEILADRFAIGREEMDGYAVASHQRAAGAAGRLAGELVPLISGDGGVFDHDDGVRPDTDLTQLARLRPVFDRPFGLVTAGNSAQVSDGAAWLLLASEAALARHQLTPRGRVWPAAWAGLDPAYMGLGPVHALAPLLAAHGLSVAEVDAWEINEAFAAQVLACLRAMADEEYCRTALGSPPLGRIDLARLNVEGGALAVGHPVGASGARIVLHLLNVLQRGGGRRGVAALCIGGGQGGAMLVERLAGEGA